MVVSRWFYNWESDKVETDVDLFNMWQGTEEEEYYPHFSDFVDACQTWNNGALEEITYRTFKDYVEHQRTRTNPYKVYDFSTGKVLKDVPEAALVCFEIDYAESTEDLQDDIDNIIVYIP